MRAALTIAVGLFLVTGCATGLHTASQSPAVAAPPMREGGPNWAEVDKSVQRIKEREKAKPRLVETQRTVEQGFPKMSDEEYARVLDRAYDEVRNENSSLSNHDIKVEAVKRADQTKWRYETSYSHQASSTYEWKQP